MKLSNTFPDLDILINKMGAKEFKWKSSGKIKDIKIQKLLSVEGVDKKLEDIQMDEYGLMYIEGQPVILFIKDQWIDADKLKNDPKGKHGYRFHVVGNCNTIEEMQRRKRYDRYTFTANQSGKFSVFARESRSSNRKVKLVTELAVCMNCLVSLKYEGSGYSSSGRMNNETRIAKENFNIKKFFKNFVQTLINKPKYSEISYPEPEYNSDYRINCRKLKEAWSYKCSRCKVDLNNLNYRHLLHCHHIDGNPGNNNELNLEILCICCHAEEGFHLIKPKKMRAQYEKCQDIKKEQKIKI